MATNSCTLFILNVHADRQKPRATLAPEILVYYIAQEYMMTDVLIAA